MKRTMLTLASCLLFACSLAFFAPTVGAHAASSGSIAGVVVNGTHQNTPVAGLKVTLQRSAGNTAQDIATTTTDHDGRFSFTGVTNDASVAGDTYAVYAQFQGGMFSSQSVNLGDAAATTLTLSVFDTTNDDSNLRVSVATLLVRQPRALNGLIGLGEIISIQNTGTTAFVGTPTGDASKPMRLLRFATPPDASDLSLGIGFSGAQIITTDKGFGATATVPPGTTDFAFSIDLPYTGTAASISYKAVYPTTRAVVLVSPDMFVNGGDFQAQGLVDSLGVRYQVFTVASTAAGRELTLQLTGLPEAGEKSNLDAHALMILAAILALLALLLLLLYLRRGSIAPALGLVPAAMTPEGAPPSAPVGDAQAVEADERDRLLRELLALEQAHMSSAISDVAFRQRDRELRRRLRMVMGSAPAQQAAGQHHTAATGETQEAPGNDGQSGESDDAARHEAASEQSSGGRR